MNHAPSRVRPRRGTVLIGVLACLLVGTLLSALSVQAALRGRREARLQRQLAQTEWLCEGGILRAVSAIQKKADYGGETWQPELGIEPFCDAVVEIKVEVVAAGQASPSPSDRSTSQEQDASAQGSAWKIQVTAHLDSTSDGDGPMQRTRTIVIPQSTKTEQSSATKLNSEKSE